LQYPPVLFPPARENQTLRRPEMVAREMELLHQQMDATVFMFQDDDFPLRAKSVTTGRRNFAAIFA